MSVHVYSPFSPFIHSKKMGDDALIDQVRTKKGDIPFCTRTEGTGADGRQQFEAYVDGSIHIHPL